jgi:L-threonylcarbamoyladenylate synthase
MTRVISVDPVHPDPDVVLEAARVLRDGGLVAFPTETVYGLGANALDPEAVARIYAAKGRPAWNPVIAHVANVEAARALTASWTSQAQQLADAFWPGPLTIVLPRSSIVPDIATAGLDAVAIRIPAHPVALALLRATGHPVAAPSANRFTQISPTTAQHVMQSLGERVDLVLDGGPCAVGIESSVCDLTGDVPTLLRPGMITRTALGHVLGTSVRAAQQRRGDPAHGDGDNAAHLIVPADGANIAAQRSPGMADRHYAPRAEVWLFETGQAGEIGRALSRRHADARSAARGRVTALLLADHALPLDASDRSVRMPDDPAEYARQLYAQLHAADAADSALVLIEQPPDSDAWAAVLDRLTRAAR